MRFRLLFTLALGCGACFWGGCLFRSDSLPPEPVLYPVTGKVTVQGKPLAEAVVTFLPVDEKGTLTVAETDDDGNYVLSYLWTPGTAAGEYKVGISYLVGTDGTVYGLAPRSGLAKPYGLFSAKELVPPEWSDLGRATHHVTVSKNGGVFDFDIQEPLLDPPDPTEDDMLSDESEPSESDDEVDASKDDEVLAEETEEPVEP